MLPTIYKPPKTVDARMYANDEWGKLSCIVFECVVRTLFECNNCKAQRIPIN